VAAVGRPATERSAVGAGVLSGRSARRVGLYFWRRELAKRDAETPTRPLIKKRRSREFLPVVLQSTGTENRVAGLPLRAEIEIQFPDATTLRVANGASAETLRLILTALRGEAC
jgi:hypothetical protein